MLAFARRARDPHYRLIVCCNFAPVPREDYRLGVPHGGVYDEVFNGDSAWYGGSNLGNSSPLVAQAEPHHGRPSSLTLTLPPLAAVVLKPRR